MDRNQMLARIDHWLKEHRQEIIEDIQGLVHIPSVSVPDEQVPPFGQACRDALSYMYALAEKHGYPTRDFEHYVGAVDFNKGDASVGIWSHLDVVPVPDPAEWVYPPFACELVEDRYLIGRGVQDNKMTAVAVLHVMNCLRELGVSFRHGYSLYMGTSEETGMEDCRYFVAHHPCPDMSLVPDTGFPVCVGQRGCMTLRVSVPFVHAVAIHESNNPSVTPNHIEAVLDDGTVLHAKGDGAHVFKANGIAYAAHDLLDQLAEHYPAEAEKLHALKTLTQDWHGASLGMAYTDAPSGALQQAPTFVYAENGRLALHMYTILPVTADAEALMASAQAAASAAGAQADLFHLRNACYFPADHPVVAALTDTYREVTGFDGAPFVMTGGNYAAILPNAFGFGPGMPGREFPAHIFKPGHGDYHQCDESEDVEHILNFMRVYAMGIITLEDMDSEVILQA